MIKNNLYYIILIILPLITFSQEKSKVITGDELRKVFFLDYNHDSQFNIQEFENFNLTTYPSIKIKIFNNINMYFT